MNASYANKRFSEKSISEIIAYVGDVLELKFDISKKIKSQWHTFMFYCSTLKSIMTLNTPLQLKGYIAILEYQVAVHDIYIKNKNWNLNRENLASKKEILTHAIRYFTEWKYQRVHVMESMKLRKKDTDKFFIAEQTFQNLLQCVGGFFEYSKAVLSVSDVTILKFVPGLHSNQSSVENFFSRMRQLGKDRTDLYAGGLLQQNVVNDIRGNVKKRKICNTSYPASMSTEEQLPIRKETRIGENILRKRSCIQEITDTAIKNFPVGTIGCSYVALDFVSIGSAFGTISMATLQN